MKIVFTDLDDRMLSSQGKWSITKRLFSQVVLIRAARLLWVDRANADWVGESFTQSKLAAIS